MKKLIAILSLVIFAVMISSCSQSKSTSSHKGKKMRVAGHSHFKSRVSAKSSISCENGFCRFSRSKR